MTLYRSNGDYSKIYRMIRDLFSTGKFVKYEQVDWQSVAKPATLRSASYEIGMLSKEEYDFVVSHKAHMISQKRVSDLHTLFWLMARIQADPELLAELRQDSYPVN